MRVLVEQTEHEALSSLSRLGLLWNGKDPHGGQVGVHCLMGGSEAGDWHLHPEHCAVLIGTQDMLLSRALNRGYASPRARWPMEFGLLNQDSLWVMDEVQLMDVGLATSAQLQAFRDQDKSSDRLPRPCRTWWMSATLQRDWLDQSPDTDSLAATIATERIQPEQRLGSLWEDVRKPLRIEGAADNDALASLVSREHVANGRGSHGPSLVVVNTVARAVALHAALKKDAMLSGTDVRLVHSRFRSAERSMWRGAFLNRAACAPGTDRIIVATQVIEAGVDISAGLLITTLAPWASLVQRFGRAARWGGNAQVIVVDHRIAGATTSTDKQQKDLEKQALPYALEDLDAAKAALALLEDASPLSLERFEDANTQLLGELYPYRVRHLLLRHEVEELFDTLPDLSGADIDISRFIRSGDERDLHVFWADVPSNSRLPPEGTVPARDALCNVPFLAARVWLCGKETGQQKAPRLRERMRAWVWDYLDGGWRIAERKDLFPGQTVLVAADSGGYLTDTGWAPDSKSPVGVLASVAPKAEDVADASEDDESLSATPRWQTIATHGAQVASEAASMLRDIDPTRESVFSLAGRWHDAGKALPPFQASIEALSSRPARRDLAKAPKGAWVDGRKLYPDPPRAQRHGFRHELASTLALFDVLIRHQPDHPALLGPWRALLEAKGAAVSAASASDAAPTALEQEVVDLSADEFDLLAYLVCSHHGKVRMAWHASPADQRSGDSVLRLRGVRDGEALPSLALVDAQGQFAQLPESTLRLDAAAAGLNPITGRGWTERVLALLHRHGPFTLAYFEALLRAADQRASRSPIVDPLLEEQNAGHGLETSHRSLEAAAAGGKGPQALAAHSAQRGPEHGLRGRAGESGAAGSATRPPVNATRYLETARGRLSYAELAPLLAAKVLKVEQDIERGRFDGLSLDDTLVQNLHTQICSELVPGLVGWRRVDVVIGSHIPPEHFRVPLLMREYARDLDARLVQAAAGTDRLLEALAFAEGRLLSIHPFADFNERATRLFLRLLLRRLDLPDVDLVPSAEDTSVYIAALAAGDRHDWQPLMAVWMQRLQQGATR